MLELTPLSSKERLWSAGAVALVMHGMIISSLAFGINRSHGTSHQDFHVEVVFASNVETGGGDVSTSPLARATPTAMPWRVGEVVAERSEETGEGYLSILPQKSVRKKPNSSPLLSGDSQLSGKISDSFPLFNPPPTYPKEARRRKIQGVVMVRASLSKEGAVSGAATIPPRIDPLLEEAALRAIRQWRFNPGIRIVEVPIEFKLIA